MVRRPRFVQHNPHAVLFVSGDHRLNMVASPCSETCCRRGALPASLRVASYWENKGKTLLEWVSIALQWSPSRKSCPQECLACRGGPRCYLQFCSPFVDVEGLLSGQDDPCRVKLCVMTLPEKFDRGNNTIVRDRVRSIWWIVVSSIR